MTTMTILFAETNTLVAIGAAILVLGGGGYMWFSRKPKTPPVVDPATPATPVVDVEDEDDCMNIPLAQLPNHLLDHLDTEQQLHDAMSHVMALKNILKKSKKKS